MLAQASRRLPGAREGTAPTPAPAAPPAAPTAEEERPRPGAQPEPPGPQDAELPDPNRATGLERVPPPAPAAPGDFLPIPDRWRLAKDLGLVKEPWYDPYNRNILKSDRPFYRDWFFNLSVIYDMTTELRSVPTPVAPQVSRGGDALDTFGDSDQFLFNDNLILALILFKGDTVFRPAGLRVPRHAGLQLQPHRGGGAAGAQHRSARGQTRDDALVGVQEAFWTCTCATSRTATTSTACASASSRSPRDFRGFLFQDNQLGVRLFGNRDNNLFQYNLAWFRRLEKDTNSGLNDISDDLRDDDVVIANLYRQDFPFPGYLAGDLDLQPQPRRRRRSTSTTTVSSRGRRCIGNLRGRDYDVHLSGLQRRRPYRAGQPHGLGLLCARRGPEQLLHRQAADIRACFAGRRALDDFDWIRVLGLGLYASGDDDPFDDSDERLRRHLREPAVRRLRHQLLDPPDHPARRRRPVIQLNGRNGC